MGRYGNYPDAQRSGRNSHPVMQVATGTIQKQHQRLVWACSAPGSMQESQIFLHNINWIPSCVTSDQMQPVSNQRFCFVEKLSGKLALVTDEELRQGDIEIKVWRYRSHICAPPSSQWQTSSRPCLDRPANCSTTAINKKTQWTFIHANHHAICCHCGIRPSEKCYGLAAPSPRKGTQKMHPILGAGNAPHFGGAW